MSADREQLRKQLADVVMLHAPVFLSETGPISGCWCGRLGLGQSWSTHLAELQLPVVQAHTRAARADELEQAATDLDLHGRFDMPDTVLLRARARALRTHEGDVDA